MAPLRISAISYLNTAPLMWDFEHVTAQSEFNISYTIPSACAAALQAGAADIGIIPTAAYASIPDLVILPDVAIAARQAVRSILLVSKVPREQIRTVALDTSSLTSVALTKVLFAKWSGPEPTFAPASPNLENMLSTHDSGLLIGDPALKVDRSTHYTYDLAEEWIRLTGKPFVFAFWAARKAALDETPGIDLAAIFRQSRDHGLEHVDELASQWADRLELSVDEVRLYLKHNIYYYLDPGCVEGLQLFYKYAAECGALPAAPTLRYQDGPRALVS
jgi:chorismate dehydratase